MKKYIIISMILHAILLPMLLHSLINRDKIDIKEFDIIIEQDANKEDMKKSDLKKKKRTVKTEKNKTATKQDADALSESAISLMKEHSLYVDIVNGRISGIKLPMPEYPSTAKKWGYTGTTEVRIIISTNGKVKDVSLIKSSGYSILDKSVISTVEAKWIFPKPENEITIVKSFEFDLR